MSDLADRLQQMLEASEQIGEYLVGLNREAFLSDKLRQQAVALNLIIIGESATRLLDEHADFLARYPGVEWKAIKGMRNRIAHGYFDIDQDIVWDTAQNSIPALVRELAAMMREAVRVADRPP